MADPNKDRFEERLKAISVKTAPGKRVERHIGDDGLVVEVVKRERRGLIPYRTILLIIVLGLVTKGFLFARLGEAEYLNRISELRAGSGVEVSAAFMLDADPVTRWVAGLVGLVLPARQ
ncbi:MAG: hypothetical protein AAGA12_02260 [Pseudomonadota bacterium]